jgi:hypothetical protein
MPSQCPNCFQQFGDVPSLAGKSLACPSCHQDFVFAKLFEPAVVRPAPILRRKTSYSGTMWAMGITTLCWLLSLGLLSLLPHQGEFWTWCIGATIVYVGAISILGVNFAIKARCRR